MKQNNTFFKTVCSLAVPVTLQSMLQSSFGIVDQIMIGQLGDSNVAGVGFATKFASIYSVLISAIGAVAGIMISQYIGQKNNTEVKKSFYTNLKVGLGIAFIFFFASLFFSSIIMGIYTKDKVACQIASTYLLYISFTFIPLAGTTMISTLMRCMNNAKLPLYASIVCALLNTGLNYILIFGNLGVSPMGVKGAAVATVISQGLNLLIMIIFFIKHNYFIAEKDSSSICSPIKGNWQQYLTILFPILVCEFAWSLGENVYAAIYGHIGTDASAAMTLTGPIQGLLIGALCGLSQAASIIIGKKLGNKDYEDAYTSGKKLLIYGLIGATILSAIVLLTRSFYVQIYDVDSAVKAITSNILIAYALIAPFKVLNMIIGGGIIRSGGKTKYVMYIDLIGTWCIGVPLGLFAAFALKLSIPYVYFILSLEECVRFFISLIVFRQRKWMRQLKTT